MGRGLPLRLPSKSAKLIAEFDPSPRDPSGLDPIPKDPIPAKEGGIASRLLALLRAESRADRTDSEEFDRLSGEAVENLTGVGSGADGGASGGV